MPKARVGRSKKERFLCAKKTYLKIIFLNKKKLGDRLSSKDNTKTLFCVLKVLINTIVMKKKIYVARRPMA